MYKCSDCGKITKEKPQYCDCGNNVFVKVADAADSHLSKQPSEPFLQKYAIDKLSLSIFILCLVFAVIPWFFVLRQQPAKENNNVSDLTIEKKEIPDFDKLWDDTPVSVPVQPQPAEPVQEEPQTIIEYVTQIIQVPKQPVSKPVQSVNQPKPKAEEVKTKPPVKTTPKKNDKPDVIDRIEKNLSQSSAPKQVQTHKPQESKTNVSKNQTTAPAVQKPTARELAELNNYKNTLRVVLLSKLKVQSIIGEGECDIEFAIDGNGKLINRKFTRQSANKTLNDAVYYMLMSVPVYQVPPKAYNGETIRLHFYINNGYYEISFK